MSTPVEPPPEAAAQPAAPTTWQELDAVLGRLRVLTAELAGKSARFDRRIQVLEAEKAAACQPVVDQMNVLEAQVLAFTDAHRGELPGKKRSMTLVHGTVGLRAGRATVTWIAGEETAIRQLRARGHHECLVTTEAISKTKVAELPVGELRLCGIELRTDEKVYYKLTESPVIAYPETES